jgi:hypothetical protein
VSIIETIFALFEVQIESMSRQPIELLQTAFGKGPEALNAVDMIRAQGKSLTL